MRISRFISGILFAILLMGCRDVERPSLLLSLLAGSHDRVGVVSSDLSHGGRFTLMDPEGLPQYNYTSIHSDAVARVFGGRVYIVNRLGRDNVQILNPDLFYMTEGEISTGVGSNPHDIAFVSENRAYVTLYERSYLQMADPAAGVLTGTIDLSSYADADGIPEMSGAYAEDDRLYVVLQRLDRDAVYGIFPPADYSLLLEIDTNTNRIVAAHRTPYANPLGKPERVVIFGQPHLILPMAGRIGVESRLDGGVVAFNLSTHSFRADPLYRESAAGGDILACVIKNDTAGYALVQFLDGSTALHRFNPSTGEFVALLDSMPSSSGYLAAMMLDPNGVLYVAESGLADPGVVLFDTEAGDMRRSPLPVSVGLRPMDFVYIP